MRISFKIVSASLLMIWGTATAEATLITDTNTYGSGAGAQLIGNGSAFTDSWSLLPYGYVPGTHALSSAVISFTLVDTNSSNVYSISLAGSSFLDGGNFRGTFATGGELFGVAFGQLSSTGVLSYTIANASNANQRAIGPQFRLQAATLTAKIGTSAAVPDAAPTAVLLTLGLISIVALRFAGLQSAFE